MYTKLNRSHKFLIWMGCGEGKNTKVKLMARWGLLLFSLNQNIVDLEVVGDSIIPMVWATGKYNL